MGWVTLLGLVHADALALDRVVVEGACPHGVVVRLLELLLLLHEQLLLLRNVQLLRRTRLAAVSVRLAALSTKLGLVIRVAVVQLVSHNSSLRDLV